MRSHVQYCSDEHSECWELAVGFAKRSSWVTLLKPALWNCWGWKSDWPEPQGEEKEGRCSHKDRGAKKRGTSWWPSACCSPTLPSSRSTIFVRLHTNGNQELQYQPGDHLGVFPGNHEDLVSALIERLEDAPPVNQLVKVELLEERNTALGNYGQAGTPPSHSRGPFPSPRRPRVCLGLPFPSGYPGRRKPVLPSCQSRQESGSLSPPAYETEGSPSSWLNNLDPTS